MKIIPTSLCQSTAYQYLSDLSGVKYINEFIFKAKKQIVDLGLLFTENYFPNYFQSEFHVTCLASYNICYVNINRNHCFLQNLPKTH